MEGARPCYYQKCQEPLDQCEACTSEMTDVTPRLPLVKVVCAALGEVDSATFGSFASHTLYAHLARTVLW